MPLVPPAQVGLDLTTVFVGVHAVARGLAWCPAARDSLSSQ
jgi:hypothetical protein